MFLHVSSLLNQYQRKVLVLAVKGIKWFCMYFIGPSRELFGRTSKVSHLFFFSMVNNVGVVEISGSCTGEKAHFDPLPHPPQCDYRQSLFDGLIIQIKHGAVVNQFRSRV